MFLQILTSHNFKTFTIQQSIGIKKSTLATIFLRIKRRGSEIYYFFKNLSFSKKTLAKFHHVQPIELVPYRINSFRTLQPEIKIESVNIKCYSFFRIHD